jgi:putative ABC transport system permease protein
MATLVFEVSTTDPATFGLLSVFLIVVAAVASYLPARQAAKTDPMVALRND